MREAYCIASTIKSHFQCERQRQKSFSQRASLHLDLASPQQQQQLEEEEEEEVVGESEEVVEDGGRGGERKKSSFVTVINVPAPKEGSTAGEAGGEAGRSVVNGYNSKSGTTGGAYNSGTYTKPRPAKREPQGAGSLGRRPLPRLPGGGGRLYRRQESKESLGSVSSPLSPLSSPVEGGGEAPALMLDSSSPSPPTTTNSSGRTKPEPPVRAPRAREQDQKSVSSSEDLHLSSSRGSDLLTSSRGRPDGGEGEEEVPPPAPLDRTSKVCSKTKIYIIQGSLLSYKDTHEGFDQIRCATCEQPGSQNHL